MAESRAEGSQELVLTSKAARLRGRTPTQEELDISLGDVCKAVSLVTIRAGESLATEVVATLHIGAALQILEIGQERRAKVAAGSLVGWVSLRTKKGEPLICKRRAESLTAIDRFKVGATHELSSMVTVRAGEALETPVLTQLKPGIMITILEISSTNKRRAKVSSNNIEGWISLATKNGDLMIGNSEVQRDQRMNANTVTVKSLLEAGRSGEVAKVRSIVEDSEGSRSRSSLNLNLNSSDIRGRTTLIYAAAFGNKDVVNFLLTRPDVDVNALDDTQKSALHHASKKARADSQDRAQAEIVSTLISHGAYIEARDHNGCTALMFAVANGDELATKVLVEANANINVKNFDGHTPLDYAVNFGHENVAKILRRFGAEGEDSDGEAVPQAATDVGAKAPKAKKKVAKPKKKRSVQQALRRQSMALTTTEDAAGMGLKEISVIADTPVEDEKAVMEKALSKLKAVTESSHSPKELEAAIKEASQAGVPASDIENAERRVQALKERVKAREELYIAIQECSVPALEAAIANAQEHEVPTADIEAAKNVLREELPRQEARERLKEAEDRGDSTSLRAALEEARRVKLDESELSPIAELLRGAESKEKAASTLQKAVEERNVSSLRFAIQQAREAGVDGSQIDLAEGVLKEEEPRQKARENLVAAMETVGIEELRAAIAGAKEVGLMPAEYSDAEILLENEEKKLAMLAEVNAALEKFADVDFTNLEALKEAKDILTKRIAEAKETSVAEADLLPAEQRRRKIHNGVEDIKGSIRVFCRVRPLSSKETNQGDTNITKQVDVMTLALQQQFGSVNFGFDAVFTPGTQDEVFEDCRDLVQSALDGYNVTMFAYGQTGAGKTFTMYGVPGLEGTAPRTIKEIFRLIERDQSRFNYTVMGSMVELYKNDLFDLLNKKALSQGIKLNVRSDRGMVMIEHLVEEECRCEEELMKLMERGNEQRHVAETSMNKESSRSHLLLMIKIVSVNRETRDQLRGKILMCDLAGSERLKKSEVTGNAQAEAIEINKSLTALGDVIEALTKQQKMIPYRNHKLTQVMQDALGGSSKTLMFVNCSPASSNVDETTMSLKYATRAKNVTNKAVRSSMMVKTQSQNQSADKSPRPSAA